MSGDRLHADPKAISAYARDMQGLSLGSISALRVSLSQLASLGQAAFGSTSSAEAGVFAEGQHMAAVLGAQSAAFAGFTGDAGKGLFAVACAAQACANSYVLGDIAAAEQINLARFAFAESSDRPPGVTAQMAQTIDELARRQPGGGEPAQAVADPGGGTPGPLHSVGEYGDQVSYSYPDGSSRTVTTNYDQATGASSTAVVTYGVDGTEVGRTSSGSRPGPAGVPTQVRESGTAGKPGHVVITVLTNEDRSQTVSTVSTGVDAKGKPVDSTRTSTVAAPPPASSSDADKGPMQQAIDVYGRKVAAEAGVTGW